MIAVVRRGLVTKLLQEFESNPVTVNGEVSNEQMLENLQDLLASLPAPPPIDYPSPPPSYEFVIAGDYVRGDVSDPELSFITDIGADDDDNLDYFPPLDVHESEDSSDVDMDAGSESVPASESESDDGVLIVHSKQEVMELVLGQPSRATDDIEIASTSATIGEREHDGFDSDIEIFSDIIIDDEGLKSLGGLGDSPNSPIIIE